MKDSYAPVLKMLGQRQETGSSEIVWIVVVLVTLPLLLLLGNYIRLRIQRRRNRERGFEQLAKIGAERGLTYPEETLLEQIAITAKLANPASLLTSIETFDRALSVWTKSVMQMPWLEVEAHVAHLTSIRQKMGFRYLSPQRPPVSTRQLRQGQKIYSLAMGKKGLRLISAEVIALDDLAITTTAFSTTSGNVVKLSTQQHIWGFFWSQGGGEFRFRTHPLKEFAYPAHHLLLQHGDELFHAKGHDLFTCQQNRETVIEWISSGNQGPNLSPKTFDRVENPPTIAISLLKFSGSGCTLCHNAQIEIDDLIRFSEGDGLPTFLNGCIGRVIVAEGDEIQVKFIDMSSDTHEALIRYIAQRLSPKAFQKALKKKRRRRKAKT